MKCIAYALVVLWAVTTMALAIAAAATRMRLVADMAFAVGFITPLITFVAAMAVSALSDFFD